MQGLQIRRIISPRLEGLLRDDARLFVVLVNAGVRTAVVHIIEQVFGDDDIGAAFGDAHPVVLDRPAAAVQIQDGPIRRIQVIGDHFLTGNDERIDEIVAALQDVDIADQRLGLRAVLIGDRIAVRRSLIGARADLHPLGRIARAFEPIGDDVAVAVEFEIDAVCVLIFHDRVSAVFAAAHRERLIRAEIEIEFFVVRRQMHRAVRRQDIPAFVHDVVGVDIAAVEAESVERQNPASGVVFAVDFRIVAGEIPEGGSIEIDEVKVEFVRSEVIDRRVALGGFARIGDRTRIDGRLSALFFRGDRIRGVSFPFRPVHGEDHGVVRLSVLAVGVRVAGRISQRDKGVRIAIRRQTEVHIAAVHAEGSIPLVVLREDTAVEIPVLVAVYRETADDGKRPFAVRRVFHVIAGGFAVLRGDRIPIGDRIAVCRAHAEHDRSDIGQIGDGSIRNVGIERIAVHDIHILLRIFVVSVCAFGDLFVFSVRRAPVKSRSARRHFIEYEQRRIIDVLFAEIIIFGVGIEFGFRHIADGRLRFSRLARRFLYRIGTVSMRLARRIGNLNDIAAERGRTRREVPFDALVPVRIYRRIQTVRFQRPARLDRKRIVELRVIEHVTVVRKSLLIHEQF